MSQYKRAYQPGGWYFFTVVTYNRRKILTQEKNLQRLREAFRHVMAKHPFTMEAIVILPDHLHCLWKLPEGDTDFSGRWRLIKHYLSMGIEVPTKKGGEKMVWQNRFWEHLIRDEVDWQRHMDYIHYNPVKHGYVKRPADWPHGSFLRAVQREWYPEDWGTNEPVSIREMEYE